MRRARVTRSTKRCAAGPQISEWTAADEAHANAQLAAFKGRIARDQWVKQAKVLAHTPDAARKPADF